MFFKKNKISKIQHNLDKINLRKFVKTIVIDDEPDSFPTQALVNEGFNVRSIPSIDENELERLERGEYDIIILDIVGVAKDISIDDGIGILRTIKKNNPSQIIIAFSGKTFDFNETAFFREADDMLPKPVDLIKCRDTLDEIIKSKINIIHYWSGIQSILKESGITKKQIVKIEHKIASNLRKNREIDYNSIFKSFLTSSETIARCVNLATRIAALIGAS